MIKTKEKFRIVIVGLTFCRKKFSKRNVVLKNSYLLSVIEKFSVWIDGVNFSHFKISTLSKKCSLSACPGYETYDGSNFSEDCLYMNIYKPSGAQNLPIFIWIHGGGFVDGQRLGSKFEITLKLKYPRLR